MNTPHPYSPLLPSMLREEIQRIFLPLLTQQLAHNEDQKYLVSVGTHVFEAVQIELRTVSQGLWSQNHSLRMISFRIESTPTQKYEKILTGVTQKIRWSSAKNYTVRTNKKLKKSPDIKKVFENVASNWDVTMVISWETHADQASEISSILAELGMFASEFDTNELHAKIGFITGNQLGQIQKIPTTLPLLPKLVEGVSREVYETMEVRKWSKKKWRILSRNGQFLEETTKQLLQKVQNKGSIVKRDDSYVNASERDQIIQDYESSLGLQFSNPVCQSILDHPTDSVFEIEMWHQHLKPLIINVGEFNRKYAERSVEFGLSIKESDADKIWDELGENFKKNSKEIGDYEFEVIYPIDGATDMIGEASINLEIPIVANEPEKIREVLFLFWKLLFEIGYPILRSPTILPSFANSNQKLQKLVKSTLKRPKLPPPSNR